MTVVEKTVGYYNKDTGEYIKDFSGQGWYYKDVDAFNNKTGEVCYIPELSDDHYSYADFIKISKENKIVLEYLFDTVDWQSPETLFNDLVLSDEIDQDGHSLY
jgi:hypothetical protein